jgi:hypothetical protein
MGQVVGKKVMGYLLIGIVVALTGFEFAFRAPIYLRALILLFIAIYFFSLKKKVSNKFFFVVIPFLIPLFLQSVIIGNLYRFISNGTEFLIQLLICYFVFEIVKGRFNITFVNFIFFLAIISLIFYPIQFLSPTLDNAIKNGIGSLIQPLGGKEIPEAIRSKTLIFYTYMAGYNGERNSGAFWEPGMFAVFLNIALLINVYINKKNLVSLKNFFIIIAILTTLSTTGYIALFCIFFSKFIFIKNRYMMILYMPLLIVFVYVTYTYVWNLDIINDKIENNYDYRSDRRSRFGAFLYHINKLHESPLTGVAVVVAESEKNIPYEDRLVSPNGLSLVFFVWGIPIGIYYYILFYKGIRNWLRRARIKSKATVWLFIFIFLLLAFSQDVTIRYFYTMFLFYNIFLSKRKFKNLNINRRVYGTV